MRHPINMVLTASGGRSRALWVELANDAPTRYLGLAGRPVMGGAEAMLFAFPRDVAEPFSARTMLFGMDFAVLDSRGVVLWVRRAIPRGQQDLIEPPFFYRYALEAPAGSFAEWGVEPGSWLRVPEIVAANSL